LDGPYRFDLSLPKEASSAKSCHAHTQTDSTSNECSLLEVGGEAYVTWGYHIEELHVYM
jgi:hypothetical protein